MIPPRKSALLRRLFRRHVARRLARHFGHLWIAGLEDLDRHLAAGPVLALPNHTAWWDGLLALHLAESVRPADGYALMDAENLRRFSFFGRLGAFGVEPGDPADGARAVRLAAGLLDRPGRLLFVFPQGEERPVDAPLAFEAGAAAIARAAPGATVVPVGLRYHHGAAERPEALMSFGPPVAAAGDREATRAAQEAAVARELARIRAALAGGDLRAAGFVDALGRAGAPAGPRARPDLWARALGRLLRPPAGREGPGAPTARRR